MSGNIKSISDSEFETAVLQEKLPVLVDFWAEWCGPCKMIAPILDQIATEFSGRLIVVKINVDNNPNTPSQYGVRGIPNLILFRNGNVLANKVGVLSKSQLIAFLEEHLK